MIEENVTLRAIIPHRFLGFHCRGNKLEGIWEKDLGALLSDSTVYYEFRMITLLGENKSQFICLFNSSNVKAALTHADVKR